MEWLACKGALVWIPLGHSPDADLMAELDGRLLRVQVKTSTVQVTTPKGHNRWSVSISTNGGNRSWSGTTKTIDPCKVDYVFVLVGDGRRWFIRTNALEGSRCISLGGPKYSEFEIEPGTSITGLVYAAPGLPSNIAGEPGECPSGQRELAVNESAMPTQVRILPPPSKPLRSPRGDATRLARRPGQCGQVLLRAKRQTTIPKHPCAEAGLGIGDRLRVHSDGPGRLVFERIEELTDIS